MQNESGMGAAALHNSRKEWRAIRPESVLERGCPLPL
jgi:hypothetical protein